MHERDSNTGFWLWSFVWAALFALAHTQALSYYSNQHHYYLHGLAQAGVGHLRADWLANTHDPTPVFSWLLARAYPVVGTMGLHLAFFVLLGVYFAALQRLVSALPGFPKGGPARILFLTLLVAGHAAILRVASVRLLGIDYPWFFQAGLAAQYLLGPGLQPSAFGVLLVVSLAAFANERPLLACALAGVTCVLHSTYLLPAGSMVLGYAVVLVRERRTRSAVLGGALALAIVAPIVWFNVQTFASGDPEQLREAQRIFARVRIPHHAIYERWFDLWAGIQLGVMALGLALLWRTRMFLAMLVPAVVGVVLSLVQVRTDSDALALLFPWRFSVVLLPVSVALVFGKLAQLCAGRLQRARTLTAICVVLAGGLAASGIAVVYWGWGYYTNDAELPLLQYVREHQQPDATYLIPAKFPTLKKERPASQAKTFAPPVRVGNVGIPVDLQRFRLATGAPIYIDFKAPPYEPGEVLDWHRRLSNAERWYGERDWDRNGFGREVQAAGITHVVTAADKDIKWTRLKLVFSDENYRLYRIE